MRKKHCAQETIYGRTMSDSLAIYLHDHLAGSRFAIELLKSLQEQYAGQPLAEFAGVLEADVTRDQETLQKIIDSVGRAHLDLKEAAGWFAEKAAQLKLTQDHAAGGIGTFEALEMLVLGIRGKLALWQVLPIVREVDLRIPSLDFAKLAASAEEQGARVENQRLQLGATTFRPQP
jgi:hypothetical protein